MDFDILFLPCFVNITSCVFSVLYCRRRLRSSSSVMVTLLSGEHGDSDSSKCYLIPRCSSQLNTVMIATAVPSPRITEIKFLSMATDTAVFPSPTAAETAFSSSTNTMTAIAFPNPGPIVLNLSKRAIIA